MIRFAKPDRPVYTIYRHPPESPDHWVVRKWIWRHAVDRLIEDGLIARAASLAEARAAIPASLSLFPSVTDGEPPIFETYL